MLFIVTKNIHSAQQDFYMEIQMGKTIECFSYNNIDYIQLFTNTNWKGAPTPTSSTNLNEDMNPI